MKTTGHKILVVSLADPVRSRQEGNGAGLAPPSGGRVGRPLARAARSRALPWVLLVVALTAAILFAALWQGARAHRGRAGVSSAALPSATTLADPSRTPSMAIAGHPGRHRVAVVVPPRS